MRTENDEIGTNAEIMERRTLVKSPGTSSEGKDIRENKFRENKVAEELYVIEDDHEVKDMNVVLKWTCRHSAEGLGSIRYHVRNRKLDDPASETEIGQCRRLACLDCTPAPTRFQAKV